MSKIQELKEQANQLLTSNGYTKWGVSLQEDTRRKKELNTFKRLYYKGYARLPHNGLR